MQLLEETMRSKSLRVYSSANDRDLFVEFIKNNFIGNANQYCINIKLPVHGYGVVNQSIPLTDNDIHSITEFLSLKSVPNIGKPNS